MQKIILFISILAFSLASCTKDITDLNTDPKNASTAPSYSLFTNAQRNFGNVLASSNVNTNIYRLIVQHWQETQYPEESQYDLGTREINDAIWNALYRDVIRDIREAKDLIPTDVLTPTGTADTARANNQLAIAEILEIYAWYYLVATYGDVPYTQAMDIDNPFPKYDTAKAIYDDVLNRLDAAIGKLNPNNPSFTTADLIYGGDVEKWIKFGNSIKLKMGLLIADDDPDRAKEVVESAVEGGVFESSEDNAEIRYLSTPPNTNPIWVDLVQSGRDDFVAASTLVEFLNETHDPRLKFFFTPDQSGVNYSGADPGVQSAYAQYSHVNPTITEPDYPGPLLDYSEVEFYLAEAAARGYTVPGTAQGHYENAIRASILFWGATDAEASAFIASVPYNSANWKESIGMQQWVAFFNRGWNAWIAWRRFDYPILEPAHDALSDIPVRYPYPVNEQNVNKTNYEAAAAAIGGDKVSTKLWWDKF